MAKLYKVFTVVRAVKLNTKNVTSFNKFLKYILILGRRMEKVRTHVRQF